jgi:hypothetical protein
LSTRASLACASALVALALGCTGRARTPTDVPAGPPPVDPRFAAVPPPQLPIKVSGDRRHLVDQADRPFLLHGDAGWSIVSTADREGAERYLEDRRARGVNAVTIVLIDHIEPPGNAYGDAPFRTRGDFGTPNEAYFRHADWVVRRAAEKGMVVLLSPCYLGDQGGPEGFYQDVVQSGAAKMREWGRFVGQRYRSFDNVVWLDGGDYNPPPEGLALLTAVVEGIRSADDRHIHAVHWSSETSGREISVPWLDLNTTYTYQPVYLKTLPDQADATRPFILLEAHYENEHDSTTQRLRSQAYYAMLSGASGHVFGSYPVWKFAAGWPEHLDTRGARSMTHLRSLLTGRAWYDLAPDASNRILVAGQGAFGGTEYALLASDPAGRLALAYLPSVRTVTIDGGHFAGPVRAAWFDPSDGTYAAVAGSPLSNRATHQLAPPGANAEGAGDWVLVLEAP